MGGGGVRRCSVQGALCLVVSCLKRYCVEGLANESHVMSGGRHRPAVAIVWSRGQKVPRYGTREALPPLQSPLSALVRTVRWAHAVYLDGGVLFVFLAASLL